MKRAARLVLFASTLEWDARVDYIDNINPAKKVINKGLGDSSSHHPILARKESSVSQKGGLRVCG